jgi:hypothetical protein
MPTCETRIDQTANCESADTRTSLLAAVCVADLFMLSFDFRGGPRARTSGAVELLIQDGRGGVYEVPRLFSIWLSVSCCEGQRYSRLFRELLVTTNLYEVEQALSLRQDLLILDYLRSVTLYICLTRLN